MGDQEPLTRRAVRHQVLRLRNARIAADGRDPAWPVLLRMSSETLEDLLMDSDPAEAHTLDFEGLEFMGIPVAAWPAPPGEVSVVWPVRRDVRP